MSLKHSARLKRASAGRGLAEALGYPADVLEIQSPCGDHDDRTVRWAIADLLDVIAATGPDAASSPTEENRRRMQWLLEHPDEVNLPKIGPDRIEGLFLDLV